MSRSVGTTEEKTSERAFRRLIDGAGLGLVIFDADGRVLYANKQALAELGDGRDGLVGRSVFDILFTENLPAVSATLDAIPPGGFLVLAGRIQIARNLPVDIEVEVSCELGDEGERLLLAVVHTQREVERMQERYRLSLAARVGKIAVWDYDIVRDHLHCDDQWYAIMGRSADDPIRTIAEFRPLIHPDDVERATEVELTAARLIAAKQDYAIVFRIIRPDGEIRWVRSAACMIEDASGAASRAVGFLVDITDTWLAEEQLKTANLALQKEGETLSRQAMEDPLTRIANRRRLDLEVERACLHAARTGTPIAIAMIDVDCFKAYNDNYGHAKGDAALKAIASALSASIRDGYDFLARYGGEEFVVLFYEIRHVEPIIERMMAEVFALNIPHEHSSFAGRVTISCGCVISSVASIVSPDLMLEKSDRNLYKAKGLGRNTYVISTA
ncbi:MAG TPA: diguanylate cyclase [Hansschlegelia sp.]